ncbi:hypothetical protein [Fischerella sp. PCC 9605]|uniref:hypothetical protein n=1 Tax=Fischerella sp. PCC 9605 TaxID=1173024 RepID=UPI0004B61AF9|nr:hypothetical protein [Fischerella sp. PCC 9605]
MNSSIAKIFMSLATSIAVLTLAVACDSGYEYEEDDRYNSTVPENQQFVTPTAIYYQA